jgi:Fur family ferric uptake transcriptional regulator
VIHAVIRDAAGPLTVAEIHEVASRERSIGIATVYRTVNLLLERRLIQDVTLPDGQTRYEAADLDHHHHFHCRKCGQVFDLPGCAITVDDGQTLPGGFEVESHEVTFIGLCPKCGKEKRSGGKRGR